MATMSSDLNNIYYNIHNDLYHDIMYGVISCTMLNSNTPKIIIQICR